LTDRWAGSEQDSERKDVRHQQKQPCFEGEVEHCINGGVVALGAVFGERRLIAYAIRCLRIPAASVSPPR
jgi:hypothetical protein